MAKEKSEQSGVIYSTKTIPLDRTVNLLKIFSPEKETEDEKVRFWNLLVEIIP